MLEITCTDGTIMVTKMHTYDAMGQPTVEVQLTSTSDVVTNTRLDRLETATNILSEQAEQELLLRQQYPALQDAYEKYKVMLGLVKEAVND